MVTRVRRLLAKALLLALVSSALMLLAAGGLVLLERQGLLTLRRVPSVALFAWFEDDDTETVAFVNTDVTPGSFLLALKGSDEPESKDERVWIPARAIVLRHYSDPAPVGLPTLRRSDTLEVCAERSPNVWPSSDSGHAPRLVPRGTRVPLEWRQPMKNVPWSICVLTKRPGVSLVPGPGLTIGKDARVSDHECQEFRWDHSANVMVDIDATTPI